MDISEIEMDDELSMLTGKIIILSAKANGTTYTKDLVEIYRDLSKLYLDFANYLEKVGA